MVDVNAGCLETGYEYLSACHGKMIIISKLVTYNLSLRL